MPSRRIPAGPGAGRLLHAAERQPGTGPQQLLRAAVAADATKVAALETKDAGDWLAKADKAYQDGEDQRDVDQLAYLTNQRIELAKQTIVLRNAEAQLQNASAQRAQARLDARTAQLDKLRSQLNAKQTSRGTMVTFGDVLFDLDKSDLKPGAMRNIQQLADFLQQNPERQVIVGATPIAPVPPTTTSACPSVVPTRCAWPCSAAASARNA